MTTILKFFGGVFLLTALLLGVLAAIFVPKGFAMQKSAIAYMETNVPLIVENWNPEEVTRRAAPEFLVPAVREGLPIVFQQLSKLGKLKKLGKAEGGMVVADLQLAFHGTRFSVRTNSNIPQPVWAEFVANADFEGGPAKVKMTLVRRSDDWRILGFWVGPPNADN
ncbi:MAG: hypothetical protein Q7T07_14670 [Burkholderiaceae bacterium]|jgi:hypothetical protein|nr:hypothetical protein [Burkholderiaceae bacterium]